MARIELRDANIRIRDGLSGTATINEATPGATDTDVNISTPVLTTTDTDLVPVGARFTINPTPTDEVHTVGIFVNEVTGGSYTLELTMSDGTVGTTANIAYDAVAATIETAIDVAMTGNYASWTNGDITVAGGALTANPVTLTFDGASVDELNHSPTVIADITLTVDTVGTVTTPTPGAAPVDEVQSIAAFSGLVDGGNFTLEFTMEDSTNVTTANIIYNADAATIETAIDTVMTGTYGGWTNGDITVALVGDLTANAMTLTYDGASVLALNHSEVIIADVDLGGGGSVGAVSTSANGVVAVDEIQSIAVFDGTVTSGNYTLELTMSDATNVTTANIAYNADAATIETAIDTVMTGNYGGWTNADITVAGGALTANPVTLTYDGDSVDELNHGAVVIADVDLVADTLGAVVTTNGGVAPSTTTYTVTGRTPTSASPTTNIEFSPAWGAASTPSNTNVITFLPIVIDVTIGEGNLTWTEAKEYEYLLDRGDLDTVKEGDEQPLEISLEFVYEHVLTGTGEVVTPVDAVKGIGGASEWVSSATDLCEPYAIDLEILHCVPCGTDEDELIVFPDFRWESLEYDLSAATISTSGKCNASDPTITRSDNADCA